MRIYCSGTKTWHSYFWPKHLDRYKVKLEDANIPPKDLLQNCFPTFWDCRKTGLPTMPGSSTIVDSGAHSFFAMEGMSVHKGRIRQREQIKVDDYLNNYCRFLEKYWDVIDYFIELDIALVVGMKKVEAMRKEFRDRGLMKKCILAWHPENGLADYTWILDNTESGYIGLQGLRANEEMLPYKTLCRLALERGFRTHVFALTYPDLLYQFPFYSTDSTRWLTAVQYGSSIRWDRQKSQIENVILSKKVRKDNKRGESHRLVFHYSAADQLRNAIATLRELERHLTNYWAQKGVTWDATSH